MSSYDVHIGKLISGRRELEGSGSYILCTPDKQIVEIDSTRLHEGIFVSTAEMEDALYEYCKSAMDEYIAEGNNEDVYTFSIYTDTYHGSYIIYINNQNTLNEMVEDSYTRERKRHRNKDESEVREKLCAELKYAEGDFSFMYEDMPERLEKWLGMFHCISLEEPRFLDIDQAYIFEKTLFDSQLFLIAIDVIQRLQPDFEQLQRTDDFIAYVSAADGVGGDYLTTSQLLRKCVSQKQLYKAMPDVEEKDLEFQAAVQSVKQLPLDEQVQHWIHALDHGEFGKNSPYSFWKTDYEVYEQLIGLGQEAVPAIEKHLNDELKQDTKRILHMVLEDLEQL